VEVEAWSAISEISPVVQRKKISGVFLLFPLLLAVVFGSYIHYVSSPVNSCTQLVPSTAQISFFANSTIVGEYVTYSNGTSNFFTAGACPQPVYQNVYSAVATVDQDPRFIRIENGSQFTVDPINSLSQPITMLNGSEVGELIFNDLNLTDPIYPCNMNLIYSNPIAQIYVFIPLLPNGTYVYGNESIVAYPGSELRFYCPTETGVVTYLKSQIPDQFQSGNFTFNLVSNGTNVVATNGTSYPGYDYLFNVTYAGTITQQVVFNWPSINDLLNNQEPSPFVVTPFSTTSSIGVVMRWFTNSTGLYLTVTTLA